MNDLAWRIFHTRYQLPRPRTADPLINTLGDLDAWLDEHSVPEGQPYLISPMGHYDIQLNSFFSTELASAPADTLRAYASDLKLWLTFLWVSRGHKDWRDADSDDRAAYKRWRTADPRGPHVQAVTWDREVGTVNQFYRWALRKKYARQNPIVQREARDRRTRESRPVPAELSHTGPRNHLKWLTPTMYRTWRDVGIRGFTPQGLDDRSFRGRFASRNATYTDVMIRSGMRLCEQTSLSLFELPRPVPGTANTRTWLPSSIAKYGSARTIYFLNTDLVAVHEYIEEERAEAIEVARDEGLYERIRNPLIITDPRRPFVNVDGQRLGVDQLGHAERRRLLIATPDGLEPAALWLNEHGMPSARSCWQAVFTTANERCARAGLKVSSHAHQLRHSFAVITLELLMRGHIASLGSMNPEQRGAYQRIFGDPVNWLRIRLGHRSRTTTEKYLHTLQELEWETRQALIPNDWDAAHVRPEELDDLAPTDMESASA
ncbi:site-specific integrase [Streptomyces shenzhenensis]|uniref:site-specific integrase n=1 Tax=Streptomyces shenzhenensis TaxID=943815 RepID=UPI00382F2F47